MNTIILHTANEYYHTAHRKWILSYCTPQMNTILLHTANEYYHAAHRKWILSYCTPQMNTIILNHHRAIIPQHNEHTTHTQHTIMRCSFTEFRKTSKVRHKFHQWAML